MTSARGAETGPDVVPPRTRDWVWGLIVVVGAMVLLTAALVWILVGSCSCGTRPAPGFDDAGGAVCRSFAEPRSVAALASPFPEPAYRAEAAPGPP